MAFCGLAWPFYGFKGLCWQNIDLIGLVSFFLAVIYPNSSGLVTNRDRVKIMNPKYYIMLILTPSYKEKMINYV